jgi:ATP-dependent Clp protease ATP-binding subunit ClpA
MGAMMRSILLACYFLGQIGFVIWLPIYIGYVIVTSPLYYFISMISSTDEEKKQHLKEQFLKARILLPKNIQKGEEWFELFYKEYYSKIGLLSKKYLFSLAPLARDWSKGYTPTLDQFSSPIIMYNHHITSRKKEINQIERILSKSQAANVMITGEEGVGKHTLIEELAQNIDSGKTNQIIAYKRVVEIDIERILSQSTDLNQKETILKNILTEAAAAQNIILVINNFHTYLMEGAAIHLSTILTPFAKTDMLQIIGITSPFFYQKYIRPNDQMNTLFEEVQVHEISKEEAINLILTNVFDFENKWKLIVPYETIIETVEKSNYYITDIPFPRKAIDLLDEAASYTHNKHEYVIQPKYIDIVLQQKTHVSITLDEKTKSTLLHLEQNLNTHILHQEHAMKRLSDGLKKAFVTAGTRKKPLASFLFLGSTGIGKTETAKKLGEIFFKTSESLIRFDMSFYQEKKNIAELIGSQETNNPGLLSQAIRNKPYGVLLLDEIEKADHNLLNIFLTLLDEGYFTDGYGKRVDCKNLIVIATSNAGALELLTLIKEATPEVLDQKMEEYVIEHSIFTPEFLNRFDGVLTFMPLVDSAQDDILDKVIQDISQNVMTTHTITLHITDEYKTYLRSKLTNKEFGVRNLRRIVENEIEGKIATLILENKIKAGDSLKL